MQQLPKIPNESTANKVWIFLQPCGQLLRLLGFEKMSIECKIQNDSESLEKKTPGPLLLQDRQWWRSVIIHAEISNEISTEISIDYLTPISTDHQGRQLEQRPCFFSGRCHALECDGVNFLRFLPFVHNFVTIVLAMLDATDIHRSTNINLQLKA